MNLLPESWDVVVIGAGAAGLVAAARAAEGGRRTLLVEKNRRPGVQILMSCGTRCNITQATDNRGIIAAYGPPGRFLHSALAALSVQQTIDLFEAEGVATKVEDTGKVFPVSDRATDVLAALVRRVQRSGAILALDEPVVELRRSGDRFAVVTSKRTIDAAKVMITTGGVSYPGCGTSGDGYRWAAELGHTIVTPRPALTPITVEAAWVRALQGVTIPDVQLRVMQAAAAAGDKTSGPLAERRGSLLFAHFGLSGPVALDVSRVISRHERPQSLELVIDFLPTVKLDALESQLRAACAAAGKKQLVNILAEMIAILPKRLVESLLSAVAVSSERKAAELSKLERARVVGMFKQMHVPVSGTRGFNKAEVTAGGVALEEVDSRDLQSKRVPNLYLAGEVLDLDGPIGGYNFQAAWSTGWLAGQSVW